MGPTSSFAYYNYFMTNPQKGIGPFTIVDMINPQWGFGPFTIVDMINPQWGLIQ
jgi:hypothetical protein